VYITTLSIMLTGFLPSPSTAVTSPVLITTGLKSGFFESLSDFHYQKPSIVCWNVSVICLNSPSRECLLWLKFQLIQRVQIVGILSLDRFAEQQPFEDLGCLGYHTIGVVSLRFLFVEGQATSAHSHATLPTYTFMTCWSLLSKSI
jgi:hypothetical protein